MLQKQKGLPRAQSRGFTLIELLVVIAIIGILAAMILVALNTARDKAKDARVKSSFSQIKTSAALYAEENGDLYTGFTVPTDLATDINQNNGSVGDPTVTISSGGGSYAVETTLNDGVTTMCVDATNKIQIESQGVDGVCSAGTSL